MITLHHLNDSRSHRVLWLLEELELPYEIVHYRRHAETLMAPGDLKALHPVGKSPMIEDDGRIMIESGAIVDHIITRHGGGRLAPAPGTEAYERYVQWQYYAVSSGMNPIMIKAYARAFGLGDAPIGAAADAELAGVLGYLDATLRNGDYLLGAEFSAADIQVSFIPEFARRVGSIDAYPGVTTWLARLHARPAFRRTLVRGGPYSFAS
jgi:glutathione S-transferase